MNFQNIYDNSPIFFQNIMCSVSGYQRNNHRYGKTYYDYLDFMESFDGWSLDKKLQYQQDELMSFINYTHKNSNFYAKLYKDIDISSIKKVDDLKKLPIIDKEMLRQNISDVVTIDKKRGIENHTGGTTGKSLVVLSTVEDAMKRMAVLDHFKKRLGFENLKMKRATFNGKHIVPPHQKNKKFWRYNQACKQMIFSSFHLTEENLKYYVEELNKFRPEAIDGFFTSICDIANYIERHNMKIEFSPIAIFPTSETLTESGRELLERVFQTKVYDQYASSEGAPFVTECKNQIKHIELSTGVFENIDDSKEILVTSFFTHGTPLIRYRIGDNMVLENEIKCSCENKSPIVSSIEGRKLDFLYNAEGAKINGGNVSNLFKNIPNAVIKAQLIQNIKEEIVVLLEIDKSLYKIDYDELLTDEFHHKFGNNTNLVIKHVDNIPREKSGKFQTIKNNVK